MIFNVNEQPHRHLNALSGEYVLVSTHWAIQPPNVYEIYRKFITSNTG